MAYEPDTKLRQLRKNGQVVQPNTELVPDNNGWPEPLTDESSPYKIGVTNGKNGESSMNDGINTSQKSTGGWHLPEGEKSGPATNEASGTDGQRGSNDNVSQNIWSQPATTTGPATQPNTDGDEKVRSGNPLETSQQAIGAHHKPEGN